MLDISKLLSGERYQEGQVVTPRVPGDRRILSSVHSALQEALYQSSMQNPLTRFNASIGRANDGEVQISSQPDDTRVRSAVCRSVKTLMQGGELHFRVLADHRRTLEVEVNIQEGASSSPEAKQHRVTIHVPRDAFDPA